MVYPLKRPLVGVSSRLVSRGSSLKIAGGRHKGNRSVKDPLANIEVSLNVRPGVLVLKVVSLHGETGGSLHTGQNGGNQDEVEGKVEDFTELG